MIAEVTIVCISVVACYAMKLRAELATASADDRVTEACDSALKSDARAEALRAEVDELKRHVTALQGHVNAGVFGGRRA